MAEESTRAPQDLREEEAFLALAETLSALIALIQGDKLVYVNPAGAAILGYPQEYYKGRNFWDFALPEDRATIIERGRTRQQGVDHPRRFTERLRHADGHVIWVDYSVDVIQLNGKTTTLVTGHDITDQKKAEETVRMSEALFRQLFTQSPVMICSVDKQDRLCRASDYWLKKLGYTQDEVIGTSGYKYLTPESIQRLGAALQEKIQKKEWLVKDVPLQTICKDGSVLDILVSSVAKFDDKGAHDGWITVAQDISEINEAQKALFHSEQRFRAAFQNAVIGKAVTGADLKFIQVNRAFCEMLGYSEAEFLGKTPRDFTHPGDIEQSKKFIAGILSGERDSCRQTKRYLHKDGRTVWVDMTATLVRDAEGKPSYFVTEIQDITERRRAEDLVRDHEAKLEEAQRIAHLGSWEHDIATNQSRASAELYRIAGLDASTTHHTMEQFLSCLHPDDAARVTGLVRRAMSEGVPYEYEARFIFAKDRLCWLHAIGRVDKDPSTGKPTRLYGVAQDITERKEAEELLRDREMKLAEAQKVGHIGSWEYNPTTNSSVWSEEMYRLFGVDRGTFNPARENAFSRMHPDHRERIGAIVDRALRDGTPYEFEMPIVLGNGQVRTLWVIGKVNRDASGKTATLFGVCQDITERIRSEELIRDREARLAEAQKIAHVGSWDWDVLHGRVVWSDELFRILGLNPAVSTASFDGYVMRVHADDRPAVTAQIQQGLADGLPFESEHRICRDSGAVRVVWTSCRMERDSSGKIVRMYGTAQDVTERKQAEDALRTSESRFRSLYTQAPVMMIAFGSDNRIREVSNYWLKVMGYERQEVIGQEGGRFITPESQQRLHEAMEKTVRDGERVLRSFPLVGVRKDGRTLDILCTSVIEMDEWGRPLGAIAVGVDVSDIRRAEEAVRESEARYRAMVEHAPEVIVVHDVDAGMFWDVNEPAVRMFGMPKERLLKIGPVDCSPEFQPNGRPSAEMAQEMISRAFAGEITMFEWVHLAADGRKIPCLIRLSSMPHRNRNLIRATITDISDQKALEEKIRHAEKMAAIGLLAAGVAHEIGNPLLALSMAAQSLERKSTDEYAQKKLGLIREHIDRISKIVRQMSDLARPQSAQKSSCDVNRVLERTLEVVRYDKRAKEVPIRFEPCPDVPFVQAVEDQLTQVCLNLALNALDAMAANPPARPKALTIRVRCVKQDGRSVVRASFSDTGPGIPESARSKIFQPFYTTKATGKGTGLGLSVSYRIIQEHQGTLAFECGPKDGAEFFFELPV